MAITYPITLPATPGPAQMEWAAETVAGRNVSPYTLAGESFEWPGNRWQVSLRYPRMTRAQADALVAALISLYGAGTFLLGPAGAAKSVKGTAGGAPVVSGAGQTGKSLAISGLTGILQAGDYFQVGSGTTTRLYMNLNNAGPGAVTLDIFPRLRESPADGAALVLASPQGLFRLAGNPQKWDVDEASLYGLSFEAEEAF